MTGDFAVVMTVRAEDERSARIFAAAVDSAMARMPGVPIVLVDDCSPHPLMQSYLAEWDTRADIYVMRMGPPTADGFYRQAGVVAGESCSFGHAPTLDRGLYFVQRHLGLHWAFVMDGDVIVLDDNMTAHVRAAGALLDERTIAVGEWNGTPEDVTQVHWADAIYHDVDSHTRRYDKAAEPVPAAIRAYGYVTLVCAAVNLDLFWQPHAASLMNVGWVGNAWYQSHMLRDMRTAYAPFFRMSRAAHIGAVAVSTTRGEPYGNLAETARYGQKTNGNYYSGFLHVPSVEALDRVLRRRPAREPMRPDFFVAPEIVTPTRPETYLTYASTIAHLDDDQSMSFTLMSHDGRRMAAAWVTVEGHVCRIEKIEGVSPVDERACYEELFEHTPALGRNEVWTETQLRSRLGISRHQDSERAGHSIFIWRHFQRGSLPWRWSEHYGWGRYGLGPLTPPTR